MSEGPDIIYAGADKEDGWRWPMASKFPVQHPTEVHAYVRVDLLPDHIEIYREIKRSGARRHADIARVVAGLFDISEVLK